MTPAARIQAAIEILEGLSASNLPADRFIRDWFRKRHYAGSKDRAAVAERVFDIFRHRGSYAFRMQSENPRALAIASVLAEGGDVSAIFCGEGYGPKPLADSERAAIDRVPEGAAPLHATFEFPAFLEAELTRSLGDALASEMSAMIARAPVDLRVNVCVAACDDVLEGLRAEGIDAQPTPYSPNGIRIAAQDGLARLRQSELFDSGSFEFQDEAAQIAVLLAQARPRERVLDLAAGAGGKSLALAAEMRNEGEIVACDIASQRLMQIHERAERGSLSIIRVHEGEPPPGPFDLVFVDAPCSGSGTWRRQPDQKWRLTLARLDELIAIQDSLLEKATTRVRPGGRILYATCSLLKCENEDRVAAFLARHPEFRLKHARDICNGLESVTPIPGIAEFFHGSPATTGTDGFFAAVLVKQEEKRQ